jgi:anthranilate synthase/aminodeoxychorismate synthase-like glutamine amidotransferase
MILFVDNYDSFTYNLVSMIGALEPDLRVVRNDVLSVEAAAALKPAGVVVSPGPGAPSGAGISVDLIRALAPRVPILGVCLGHQAIAEAFGGAVGRGRQPVHGKSSPVVHDGTGVLMGLPSPFLAGRYHSLVACSDRLPDCLRVQGTTAEGEVMAMRHRDYPCHGVQFHPESVLTPEGELVLRNFVALCKGGARA